MTREEFKKICDFFQVFSETPLGSSRILRDELIDKFNIRCSVENTENSFRHFGSADDMRRMKQDGNSYEVISINESLGRVSLRYVKTHTTQTHRYAFHFSDLNLVNFPSDGYTPSPPTPPALFSPKDLAYSIFNK